MERKAVSDGVRFGVTWGVNLASDRSDQKKRQRDGRTAGGGWSRQDRSFLLRAGRKRLMSSRAAKSQPPPTTR